MSTESVMNTPILSVEHLSMKFGGLVAIGDLSFEAKRGEITALIGPNGAGKTTVFNCITGFYKPSEGMIRLNSKTGREFLLERLPDYQITARAKVARTFQNIRLFSGMTVLENLLVAQHNKLMRASGFTILGLFGLPSYKRSSAESIELAKFWLDKADLTDRADDPAGDLPYGAQRRLEIARAMCTEPELLCLDEPAAGLNPKESLALNTLLIDIKKTTGTSILLIEHDMSVVMQISDHVVVLEYGRKISDGDPTFVKSDPRVIAAYLGVDDEEVTEVLAEVGDDHVIEELGIEPDPSQAPAASASMLAGPISETIDKGDDEEAAKASPRASKAAQVSAKQASAKSAPVKKAAAKPVAAKPAVTPKAAPAKPVAAAPVKPAAKAVAPAKAVPAKPVAAKAVAAKAAPAKAPPAKTVPVKAAPAKPKAPAVAQSLSAPRGGTADKLLLIKGIGPVNERKLNEHGIFHFDQIAAWKKADVVAAETYLEFDGRIAREDWVGQAKKLAREAAKAPTKAKTGGRK
ncbi:ATP-binding cassette domain-containing protein [Mesorhizobium sp. SB112]|uniref:ATP-binding cassette domain-containing protein n=1 Tax=Mesorhizobium sp. SB112 TaxID=3151853 RepID=UPI0032630B26